MCEFKLFGLGSRAEDWLGKMMYSCFLPRAPKSESSHQLVDGVGPTISIFAGERAAVSTIKAFFSGIEHASR